MAFNGKVRRPLGAAGTQAGPLFLFKRSQTGFGSTAGRVGLFGHYSKQNPGVLDESLKLAEGVGFEPTVSCPTPVFKTGALNHSATPPKFYGWRWPRILA